VLIVSLVTAQAVPPPAPTRVVPDQVRVVATGAAVSALVLVKASDGAAIIRTAGTQVEKITVGDLIGMTRAVVKEITPRRLVLEETFTGKDGKPNRALIIMAEGKSGGTRYLQRADEAPAIDVKPVPVAPGSPYGAKPSPKNPPLM
jgi:hypothetical protein